jgi:hypothetical protein
LFFPIQKIPNTTIAVPANWTKHRNLISVLLEKTPLKYPNTSKSVRHIDIF